MSTNTNDQPRRSGRTRNLSEKARDTEEQNRSNNANNGLQQYIQNPLQVNNRKDAEEAKDEEEVELRFHPEMLTNSSQSRSNRRKQQKLRILADTFKIIAGLDEGLEGMSLKRKLEIINKRLIENKIMERLSEACAEETKYRKSKGGAQRDPVVMMENGDLKGTRKLLIGGASKQNLPTELIDQNFDRIPKEGLLFERKLIRSIKRKDKLDVAIEFSRQLKDIEQKEVVTRFKRMKSKGGGVSGLDTADIKSLIYLDCPIVTKGITDYINYIRRGGLTSIAKDINKILGVGLTKESGGHRIIGISEVFTNIADSFVAEEISGTMKTLATESQYGLKANGLQELANFIQIKLESTDDKEAMVLMHMDVQITPELLQVIRDTRSIINQTVSDHKEVVAEKQLFMNLTNTLLEEEKNLNPTGTGNIISSTTTTPAPASSSTNPNSMAAQTSLHSSPNALVRSNQDVSFSAMAADITMQDANLHSSMGEAAQSQAHQSMSQSQSLPTPSPANIQSSFSRQQQSAPMPPPSPSQQGHHVVPSVSSTSAYRGSVRGSSSGNSANTMGNQILSSYTNTSSRLGLGGNPGSGLRNSNSGLYNDGHNVTIRSPMTFTKTTPLTRESPLQYNNTMGSQGHPYMQQQQMQPPYYNQGAGYPMPSPGAMGNMGMMGYPPDYTGELAAGHMHLSPQNRTQPSLYRGGNTNSIGKPRRQTSHQTYLPNDQGTNTITATPDGKIGKGMSISFTQPTNQSSNNNRLPTTSNTTSARQSVNRLQKLGSDIEELADKLNTITAADQTKWQWK